MNQYRLPICLLSNTRNFKELGKLSQITIPKIMESFFSLTTNQQMSAGFVKYQGLGNDFILIDNTNTPQLMYTSEQAVKLCNRNFGIGADGVIFTLAGENGCDYTMRIFNSDGSEPQMCGNGIRCMAKFLQEIENKHKQETRYTIWTGAGVISPTVTPDGSIMVDMGKPILQPERIPTILWANKDGSVVEAEISALGKTYKATAVSMGNPHSVSVLNFH